MKYSSTHPTIITHFYNEEFLLPLWLTHHKKYFEQGVLIDYGSTDRSVEIIRDICPHWQILRSGNEYFDHLECDREIMWIESQIPMGLFRTAITCTEFIVGDVHKLISDENRRNIAIRDLLPVNVMTGYDPDRILSNQIPLWEQVKTGIPWERVNSCRSLHNFNDMIYTGGRHFDLNSPDVRPEVQILKFSNVFIGKEMIDRRLQINPKVSPRDREWGIATHNTLTPESLEEYYRTKIEVQNPVDCSDRIDKLTKYTSKYVTCLFSSKTEKYDEIKESITPEKITYFDTSTNDNFSNVVNTCVESADSEIVILCSDKVKPTYKDIHKILTLLDIGYVFVGLHKFEFFGFKKELFRTIGPFDERFMSTSYEDYDYLIRLKEANLAYYITDEVENTQLISDRDSSKSWDHWRNKWLINNINKTIQRKLEESSHTYNFGPQTPTNFLNSSRSIIGQTPNCSYLNKLIENQILPQQ